MAVSHAPPYPGLFAPTGLLGAGPQSTAWLYMFWHGGFPLLVIAYALRKSDERTMDAKYIRLAVGVGFLVVLAVVVALATLATAGQDLLPPFMRGNNYTSAQMAVTSSTWA